MGTHPIFESDFDCLTDLESRRIMAKRTRKVVLLVSTARGTALRCERSSRRWKFLNIRNTNLPSAARLLLNEQLSASGPAHAPTKRWRVELGSPIPRTTKWWRWVFGDFARLLSHK